MNTNRNWKKDTILFLTSQTISLLGSSLVQYAIMWYITLKTQSGIMMTISIICGFLPTFFLSPFAGVWADRYNRKLLIMLSDSLIAISTLIVAILFLMGFHDLWMFFIVSVIRSVGSGIQTPAISAFIPQLVPEESLTKVNATNSSIQSLVMLVSPMLSGLLLTKAPIEMIFFIDVVTAIIAVLILLIFLKVPIHKKALEKSKISYFGDMKEGFHYINNHKFIKIFCIFNALFFILAAPVAFLTPLQVTRSFGDDIWRLTAIEITFSIGMMAGGLLMATWGGFKNKIHTMVLANLIIGFCTFALGLIPVFWIYLTFMTICGFAMPIFNTTFTVLLQQKVEENFMGRVFGVFGMITSIMMPVGMLVFGPIADYIKIEWLLIGTGIMLCVLCFFLAGNKTLIEIGKPEPQNN
ncbi:MAG: transporter [Anaerocolumna sp.]|nr:transporter [Anaerocolumna sp.]